MSLQEAEAGRQKRFWGACEAAAQVRLSITTQHQVDCSTFCLEMLKRSFSHFYYHLRLLNCGYFRSLSGDRISLLRCVCQFRRILVLKIPASLVTGHFDSTDFECLFKLVILERGVTQQCNNSLYPLSSLPLDIPIDINSILFFCGLVDQTRSCLDK